VIKAGNKIIKFYKLSGIPESLTTPEKVIDRESIIEGIAFFKQGNLILHNFYFSKHFMILFGIGNPVWELSFK